MRACEDGVLLYPVYALLFADAGLSTSAISGLFVLWSVVSFAAEVPCGALADAWSRRRLYALGAAVTAAGFAVWTLWPTYPGFLLGFVLWGLGGACCSGSLEALVYDALAADGATARYAAVAGRAGTAGILAMLAATVLAAPAYAVGGYPLVGALSVAATAASGVLALGLPEPPRTPAGPDGDGPGGDGPDGDGPDGDGPGWWGALRGGLREVAARRRLAWALAVAALVPGFTALDEYLPLLAREAGAPTVAVPLLFALPSLAMAAGSWLAGRHGRITAGWLAATLAVAALALAGGALLPPGVPGGAVAVMLPVAVAFGLLQFGIVVTEVRLQDAVRGPARATVLSLAGFGAEVAAVAVYAGVGLGAHTAAVGPLVAACAGPMLLTAVAVWRRTGG